MSSALPLTSHAVVCVSSHIKFPATAVAHRCVRLSADNSEILSCGSDSKVILWDWRTRTPTRIYSGHFISIGCCDLAEQGDRVVSGGASLPENRAQHGLSCPLHLTVPSEWWFWSGTLLPWCLLMCVGLYIGPASSRVMFRRAFGRD